MPKRIPIKAAEDIGRKNGCTQVILLTFDGELTHIVTWGKTTEDCAQAAQGGNNLKDKFGWPPDLKDQPSRVRKILKQIESRQGQLNRQITYGEMLEIANG